MPKAKVTGMNETHIFLDANPELAGQTIIITIILHDRYIETST